MSKIGSSGKPPAPPRPSSPPPSSPVSSSSSQAPSIKSSQDQVPQQPDLKPGKKTTRTLASEAHAQSVRGAKDQGQTEKQKSLLDSVSKGAGRELGNVGVVGKQVAKDVGRELGNVGVLGKQVAGSVGEQAAVYGKGMLGKLKGEDAAVKNIKEAYGKEVADDFKTAKKSVKKELEPLEKQEKEAGRIGMDANDREKLDRLRQLRQAFKDEPITIAREMKAHQGDPTYQLMGPAKFASLEVTTRKMLEAQGGDKHGLKTMERVAIYGYTTKDYSVINSAMRKGPVTDPQLSSYIGHVNSGLAKLEDFKPQPGQSLYRGVLSNNLPPSILAGYTKGGTLHDLAFTSSSTKADVAFAGYDIKLTIDTGGKKGPKIIPFSAHKGEQEVLFPPGAKFDVIDNTPNTTPGLPPSLRNWNIKFV